MEKIRSLYRFFKEKYDLLALKKFTTIAGTLVFFLIMSIVPLSFWLTLILGQLPVDMDRILALPIFESVQNILLYVRHEASDATSGASLFLLGTTLYSSTNLFYQMRKSGEIVYEFQRKSKGLKLRFGALILLFIVMATVVVFLLFIALGAFLFSRLLSGAWERIADYLLLTLIAFFLVLLLNAYVCPYKMKLKDFLPGTFITVGAWVVAIIGFSIYMKISRMDRLYGALTALIVFLLWLYMLMICFIIGVIINSEKVSAERKKAKRKRQRIKKEKLQKLEV